MLGRVVFSKQTNAGTDFFEWESRLEGKLLRDAELEETQKQQLIFARRGQGVFRTEVAKIEVRGCRVTGVDKTEHLRASHIKPWRDSDNEERLDGENGLMLTPMIDHLFDRGFITFENNGKIVISPVAHTPSLEQMGVSTNLRIGARPFSKGQKVYLDHHRELIFLEARNPH